MHYIIILRCLFSSKPKIKLTSEVTDASTNLITNLAKKKTSVAKIIVRVNPI